MSNTDLPPPYYALKEDATTEQNATEIPMPHDEKPLEAPIVYAPAFENKDARIGFIQKVLAIKLFQASAMTIVMTIYVAEPMDIYRALVHNTYARVHLIVLSLLILLATLGLLHYCNRSRFVLPYNYMYMLLGAYPLAVAFFISVAFFEFGLFEFFASWVYFNIALIALLVNSVFALQTNIEFKTNVGLIITAGIIIVTYAFTVPLIGLNAFGVLYCSLMIFALTAYILNDLQAMMSKTYRISLSPADFVKAALIMHIDYRYMMKKFFNKHYNSTWLEAKEIPMPHDEKPLEASIVYAPAFENKDTWIGFIQKVLAIKFFQAIAVTIVMIIFIVEPYEIYRALVYDTYTRIYLIVVSSLLLLVTLGLLTYCNRSRFVLPYNYMFLGAYPLAVAFFISVVFFEFGLAEIFTSWVYFNIVLFALLVNSIFALQTNIEFKTNVGLIITGGILIVTYAFTVPFIYYLNAFGVLHCSLMIFALTAYILNDLQAMMSKTYRISLSPADFVKAALIMHIDYRYMMKKFFNKHFNSTCREVNDVQS